MKQVNIGQWWGLFKLLGQHVTSYVQYINFVLITITAYSTSIGPATGYTIPSWMFGVILFVMVCGMFVFEYSLSFPSYFAVWNKQWWEHDNPMKDEVARLNEKIDRLETLIKSMQR